ncbi:MAG: phosphate transporter rane protein 2, PhoT family [Acidimicrobiales bacterium]|nr:phosphate transporter rane protein 2, PhoT family [Acidimicrobiales bacterium]
MTDLLTHGRLQRWQAAVSAGAGVAVAAGLFAITPMQGRADFVVVGYACAVAGYLVTAARIEGRRQAVDRFFHALIVTAVATCLLALGAVLVYTAVRGADALKPSFFSNTMDGVGVRDTTGGAYHAIVGTIEQVLLASLLAVPAGLLVAIYSVEYGRGRLATILRTTVDVMTGVPSIVAGLFIYAFWVLGLHQGFSGFAAAMALALLMLPIVVRSAEEMLRLVPTTLREASYALGVPRWRTVLSVVLPSASAGITTGVMLAVARVTGETAPLLLTSFGNNVTNTNPLKGPQSALPLFVFQQAGSAFATAVTRAWAGALTLIVVVLVLTTIARLLTRRNRLAT